MSPSCVDAEKALSLGLVCAVDILVQPNVISIVDRPVHGATIAQVIGNRKDHITHFEVVQPLLFDGLEPQPCTQDIAGNRPSRTAVAIVVDRSNDPVRKVLRMA